MRRIKEICCVWLFSILVCYPAFGQNAESNEAAQAEEETQLQALEAFWTADRMSAATPIPIPELSEAEFNETFGDQAGRLEEPDSDVVVEPLGVDEVAGKPTRADVNAFPYRTAGKLFFTLKGNNYSCSATFVSPDVLLTAAHCVRDQDGTWASRILFKRAYSNGGGQSVGWRCAGTKSGWVIGGGRTLQMGLRFH